MRPSARNIAIFGQEMDNATWALARMNMILHGHPTADLWRGNTLAAPHFKNPDGSLKIVRFRRRQSALLVEGMVQRAEPGP